ncbi:LOW QUALITY PROTEIN: uncharacterized protein LOC119146339 [Falco rusticolus]|uniref:LOW QUALITY PROTEIN: uncharacterized protein LOC119146339 n=1 Tax=Falco rusticolus TaxID=120794 RepID=UPI0018868D35|nr:LOW QUALITY PROTEIN: uncharacterized protein LOC119146339 [Falco rusticolus]
MLNEMRALVAQNRGKTEVLKAAFALVDTKLAMSQYCAPAPRSSKGILGRLRQSIAKRPREAIAPLFSALLGNSWSGVFSHTLLIPKVVTKGIKKRLHLSLSRSYVCQPLTDTSVNAPVDILWKLFSPPPCPNVPGWDLPWRTAGGAGHKAGFEDSPFFFSSAVAVGRAQLQQEPSAETTEDTGIAISCSHPSIQNYDFIQWYRQLPGRGPAFITSGHKGSREVQDPPGRMSVAADRRSSALWLARPRRRDAAVYYCAVETRGSEPGLRPGTNLGGRGRACVSGAGGQPRPGPPGGAAASPRPAAGASRHRLRHRHRVR